MMPREVMQPSAIFCCHYDKPAVAFEVGFDMKLPDIAHVNSMVIPNADASSCKKRPHLASAFRHATVQHATVSPLGVARTRSERITAESTVVYHMEDLIKTQSLHSEKVLASRVDYGGDVPRANIYS